MWYRWWAIAKCIYVDSNESILESIIIGLLRLFQYIGIIAETTLSLFLLETNTQIVIFVFLYWCISNVGGLFSGEIKSFSYYHPQHPKSFINLGC